MRFFGNSQMSAQDYSRLAITLRIVLRSGVIGDGLVHVKREERLFWDIS